MRISLVYKIIIALSILIFFIISTTTFYFYIETEEILENQIKRDLTAITGAGEGQLFLIFSKFKARASDWGVGNYIRNEFEKILESGDSQKSVNLAEDIKKRKLVLEPEIMITDIFNLDGVAIVSTFPERIGHTEPEEELDKEYLFNKAKNASMGETFISDLIYEEETGHLGYPMWHVSTPLISLKTGRVIGVMVDHIKGDEFYKVLSGKWQVEEGAKTGNLFYTQRKTSEMYIVNRERLMMTPSKFIEDSVLKQKVDTEPVKKCFEENQEFTGTYKNYLGYDVVGASICLSDYGMVLVAEVGEKEIFSNLKNERIHMLLIDISIWLAGILFIFFLIKFFLRGIFNIRQTALEVGKNNYNVQANVKSRDEIGELAGVINMMITNIKKSQQELKEAESRLRKINIDLEKRVEERTVELLKLKNNLEEIVKEKTTELNKKLSELEKFKELTIGRELKMIELKKEIEELKKSK